MLPAATQWSGVDNCIIVLLAAVSDTRFSSLGRWPAAHTLHSLASTSAARPTALAMSDVDSWARCQECCTASYMYMYMRHFYNTCTCQQEYIKGLCTLDVSVHVFTHRCLTDLFFTAFQTLEKKNEYIYTWGGWVVVLQWQLLNFAVVALDDIGDEGDYTNARYENKTRLYAR